ncbi:hypothetical protein [Treponema denticola]|uniref:hypothetical protein n=1 Tax=Treponema denticola TaxID=158 RepID=UPI0021066620|nr:hypothetical protein [Treponema denticola]UTY24880.1 hypothetical protein E4N78_12680 [Treponema denticola]
MRTSLKVLISLIISLAVFVGFFFLTSSGYDSFTETKIYQPAVIRSINENLLEIAAASERWHNENAEIFKKVLKEDGVKRVSLQEQISSDIDQRNTLVSNLISTLPGFMGFRIIDSQYQKIHFSTFAEDILSKSTSMISYKKYNDNNKLIPYQHIAVLDGEDIKITSNSVYDFFLYCFPFYDIYDVYRGTAVFYVEGTSLFYQLMAEKLISIGDGLTMISDEAHTINGLLTGSQNITLPELQEIILNDWERLPQNIRTISFEGKDNWVLITQKSNLGYVGRLAEKHIFLFPAAVKYFLIFTAFITLFLIFFLLLNIKRDKLFIAQNKIQQLHLSILRNYLKTSQTENWQELQQELEYHRHEVNTEIKRGIGKKLLRTKEKEIDEFLQKNWQEIFDIITKTAGAKLSEKTLSGTSAHNVNMEELLSLLMETLKKGHKDSPNLAAQTMEEAAEAEDLAPIEEATEAQELAPVEELTEAQNLTPEEELTEPEDLTPIEELTEAEELTPVEELTEQPEELAPIEEITDAEELSPVEELTEAQNLTPEGELTEPENLAPIEEITEAEELSPVEELTEAQNLTPEEELTEPEELAPIEEITEAEELSPIEELTEAKNLTPEEELTEAEDLAPMEELDLEENPDSNLDMDDPMLRLEDFGYTISGLDFSELDVPIEELKDAEAKKVEYIEEDYSPIRSMWGKYDDSPIIGNLDVVGDIEPLPLLDLNEDETIINEDGVFIIRKTENLKPENKDFKALVDSVLR